MLRQSGVVKLTPGLIQQMMAQPLGRPIGQQFRQEYAPSPLAYPDLQCYITSRTADEARQYAWSRGWQEGTWEYIAGMADLEGINLTLPMYDLWPAASLRYRMTGTNHVHSFFTAMGGKLIHQLPEPWESLACRWELGHGIEF